MGKKKKQEEPVDLFVLLQRMADERKAKEYEAWLAALTPVQRAEYRGATMAAGQVYRCLGHHAEHFGDDKLLDRLQERLHDALRRDLTYGAPGPSPRSIAGDWRPLDRVKIHHRKQFEHICYLKPKPVLSGQELQLTIDIPNPRNQFSLYRDLQNFQFVFGAGLLSDMHFSADQDEYIYQHPTLQGRFFSCESQVLPVSEPTSIDLRLQLPLPDGVPPGLQLLTTIGLWFWWSPTYGPSYKHIGMYMQLL